TFSTSTVIGFGNVLQIEGSAPDKIEQEFFQKYGKVYGIYTGLKPTLTIVDAELIKSVLQTNFQAFLNRRTLNTHHDLVNNGQFFTDDGHWKKIRIITGPTFSSSKLRGMTQVMSRCVDKLVVHLNKVIDKEEGLLQTKDAIIGLTIDVIAATSFATDTNANGSSRTENAVVKHGLAFFDISPYRALFFFTMPKWINSFVGEIIRQRKSQNSDGNTKVKYNDLVQLLMDAYVYENELDNSNFDNLAASMENDKNEEKQSAFGPQSSNKAKATLTEDEIVAQAILFFIAVSTCIFELLDSQIQDRLVAELRQALDHLEPNSEEYFETVMMGIPYLDAVVKESMRKYPPVKRLERRVTVEQFQLGNISLKKDQLVEIPVYAVHHSEVLQRPERFNPERFMPENKTSFSAVHLFALRHIGMRFAYQEIKILLAQLFRQFKFSRTDLTPNELQFDKFRPSMSPKAFQTKLNAEINSF
ncbi:hypothetical protein TYRP_015432, partial [Tyrophagus putrescentiae]